MRTKTITPAEAAQWRRAIFAAPMLDLADGEDRLVNVRRVGFLPPMQAPKAAYFQTVGGSIWRLPAELERWAVDVVAMALASEPNPFPCRITFGRDGGEIWARFR